MNQYTYQVNYGGEWENVYPDWYGFPNEAEDHALWLARMMETAPAARVLSGGSVFAAAHDHMCLSCNRVAGRGGLDCDGYGAHDYELCERCAADGVTAESLNA